VIGSDYRNEQEYWALRGAIDPELLFRESFNCVESRLSDSCLLRMDFALKGIAAVIQRRI
jgi:hypothetical protein